VGWIDTLLSTDRHVERLYLNSYFVFGLNIVLVAGCSEVIMVFFSNSRRMPD
jgi:hypothetical protein